MNKILLFVFTAFMALLFSSCTEKVPASTVSSAGDLDGKTIGVIENTSAVWYASGYGTLRTYATGESMIADLKSGVIDCCIADEAITSTLLGYSRKVKALSDPLVSVDFSVITAKESRDLLEDINAVLSELRADETLSAIENHYLLGTVFDYESVSIPENAGSLRLAVPDDFPPYSSVDENGELSGLDITLARIICDRLGVKLEIVGTAQSSIIKNVWSSRADFGMGGMYVTDAGSELVDFSYQYSSCRLRIITRK